jgi:hypothetical protein
VLAETVPWTGIVPYTLTDRVEPVYNIEAEGSHCCRVGESGVLVHNMSAPATPPSGNTNPAPPTPHFTCQELMDIVNAAPVNATGLTAGGPAGGKMVRIVADNGLNQAEAASALEEGRDYIIWYFGQGSYTLTRLQSTGTWIIFQGISMTTNVPVLAIRMDGTFFRGASVHLEQAGNTTTFNENYNSGPNAGRNKVWVYQGSNWVIAP